MTSGQSQSSRYYPYRRLDPISTVSKLWITSKLVVLIYCSSVRLQVSEVALSVSSAVCSYYIARVEAGSDYLSGGSDRGDHWRGNRKLHSTSACRLRQADGARSTRRIEFRIITPKRQSSDPQPPQSCVSRGFHSFRTKLMIRWYHRTSTSRQCPLSTTIRKSLSASTVFLAQLTTSDRTLGPFNK